VTVVFADAPIRDIRKIFSHFHEPANVVQLPVVNEGTLYAWQDLSGLARSSSGWLESGRLSMHRSTQ
jgi:hypothetical protein